MKNILSRQGREVLQQFAWSNVAVAFDYDGTLAPIVEKPDEARMRPATRRLLSDVAALYPCVVVSGRAQRDVRRLLRGIPLQEVVGNHGIEPGRGTRPIPRDVERWTSVLRDRFSHLKGVEIENKTFSVAVHYRRSRERKKARTAILDAASTLDSVRVIGGKQVVNLVPRDAPHKGIAVERERDRLRVDTAIYVGDDDTDEDVFGLDQPGRLLTVRVGSNRRSQASYYLRNQAAIDDFLLLLRNLRRHGRLVRAFSG